MFHVHADEAAAAGEYFGERDAQLGHCDESTAWIAYTCNGVVVADRAAFTAGYVAGLCSRG